MATAKLSGAFPAGTTVHAVPAVSDLPPDRLPRNAEKKAKTDKNSVTKFTGLQDHVNYWLVAEVDGAVRARRYYARPDDYAGEQGLAATRHATQLENQAQAEAQAKAYEEAVKSDPLANSPAPGKADEQHNVITGARSTENFVSKTAGEAVLSGSQEKEPQPHLRQEDTPKGTVQRSDTITGQATPKDKDESQPKIPQEDVPKGTVQRSATETGEAAIKPSDEKLPVASQDDASGVQRSDTEEGEATPKPKASPVEAQKAKDSAKSKARGRTPDKTEERVTGKAPAKKASKSAKKSSKKSAKKRAR